MSSKTASKRKRDREKRKEERQEAKRRARSLKIQGRRVREVAVRDSRPTFLIVCEGEKTEPNYFRSFPVRSAQVRVVGKGMNTESLVREALRLQRTEESDELWVVFDRDSFQAEQVVEAFRLAEDGGARVAFSHEAFEVWYLLHFHYCDSNLSRTTYQDRLTECLNEKYRKNDRGMYRKLIGKVDVALNNAEKLLALHAEKPRADAGPSTTVHLLVRRLLEFCP